MSNLIIDTPSRHVYTGDGSTRVFPIPTFITGDDWVRIEINGIHVVDRREWDIVNNSIIFVIAPPIDATIDVLVASSIEAMTQLGSTSSIDVVVENITNVNKVATIDTDVTTVANINTDVATVSSIALEIPIVSSIATDVTTVADISSEVVKVSNIDTDVTKVANIDLDVTKVANIDSAIPTVANINTDVAKVSNIDTDVVKVSNIDTEVVKVSNIDTDVTKVANIDLDVTKVANIDSAIPTVANNILDVQNAEENATIAKEEAWRAEAERLTANSYATEPEDVFVKIYISNNDGTFTVTDTTDYSAYHWERKATALVTTGVIDDTASSIDRTYSSSKIDNIVNTINNNITTIVNDNITPIENNISTIEGSILDIENNISTIEGSILDIENDVSTLDNTAVKLTGNQTVAGVKTFSSNIVGNITGNAGTATKLQTARTINGVAFDGTANITISDSIFTANDSRVKTALNAGGTAPIYACRAWVNFNGTGTVAIRASGNVSSITDLGVGHYRVNFITNMTDSNYSVQCSGSFNDDAPSNANTYRDIIINNYTTSSYNIGTTNASGSVSDILNINSSVFR